MIKKHYNRHEFCECCESCIYAKEDIFALVCNNHYSDHFNECVADYYICRKYKRNKCVTYIESDPSFDN